MMTETPPVPEVDLTSLDSAYHAMQSAPDDEKARLRFYAEFADTPLTLLLTEPAGDDSISPQMFETEEGSFVLAFDTEDRLADFARSLDGAAAEYAQIPGRGLASMLVGQGVGIALNPGVAPSEFLCTPEAIEWLVATVSQAPIQEEAQPGDIGAPGEVAEDLLDAMGRAMGHATGFASSAYLVKATHRGGQEGLMLALLDVAPGAEAALAGAVSTAVQFLGDQDLRLDVVFPEKASPFAAQVAQCGVEIAIPAPIDMTSEAAGPASPGMDPERPPKLR